MISCLALGGQPYSVIFFATGPGQMAIVGSPAASAVVVIAFPVRQAVPASSSPGMATSISVRGRVTESDPLPSQCGWPAKPNSTLGVLSVAEASCQVNRSR